MFLALVPGELWSFFGDKFRRPYLGLSHASGFDDPERFTCL